MSARAVDESSRFVTARRAQPPKPLCGLCRRKMDVAGQPRTRDLGGGCLECMAECGDPDARVEMAWVEAAELVPRNWLDPMLTGLTATVGPPPYTGTDIERVLNATRCRIERRGK